MVAETLTTALLAKDATVTTVEVYRRLKDSFRQEDLHTEFEKQLTRRIEQRAGEIDSPGLQNVVQHWGEVADEINTYDGVFDDENEAIEYILDNIRSHISLTESEENDLRGIIAEEYSKAIDNFRQSIVEDDSLQAKFETELGIEVVERLNSIERNLKRITGPKAYDLFKFPEERGEILEKLQSSVETNFVDRDELPDSPELDKYVVLGPPGSGKTRLIYEWVRRLESDSIDQVLFPKQYFLSQEDATSVGRKSFDGDLLVIWEDAHRVNTDAEGNIIKRTLGILFDSLERNQEVYTLLESRGGRVEDISNTLPEGFNNENLFWNDFTPLYLSPLNEDILRNLIKEFESLFDDTYFTGDALDVLVNRVRNHPSAPQYIETVVKTNSGEITRRDIVDLPEQVVEIWSQGPYPKLRENSISEWHILASMKILYDLNVPQYVDLVQSVFVEYIEGDQTLFRDAVESLEGRQWVVTLSAEDGFEDDIIYAHDTQLEPVPMDVSQRPNAISEFVLEKVRRVVPIDSRERVHLLVGGSMFELEELEAAGDHWEAACEIGNNPISYYNYGYLKRKFGEYEEARSCMESAIELDPDYVDARTVYGALLMNQFDELDKAGEQFRQALKVDPANVSTIINYARWWRKMGQVDNAKWQLEQALDFEPREPEALYRYGKLLNEEFGDRENAERFWARTFDLDKNYAEKLLREPRYIGRYGQSDLSFKSERKCVSQVPQEAEFNAYMPPTTHTEITIFQAVSKDGNPIESQSIHLKSGSRTYKLDELRDVDTSWLWAEFRMVNEYGILRPQIRSIPEFIYISDLPLDLPVSHG